MAIIIGASPSTGSSLLVQILNRHSELFAGPETYLFTKANLYRNWNKYKKRIIKQGLWGLRSSGMHLFNGVLWNDKAFHISEKELLELINESSDFCSFAHHFFSLTLKKNKKLRWIEKTPANCYHFQDFHKTFPSGKSIHMLRNPYDVIASLISRGLNYYHAIVYCLCNMAVGLKMEESEKHLRVKYEDLVRHPVKEVHKVCQFLSVKYEPEMLKPGPESIQMDGWKSSETGKISDASIGRFEQMDENIQRNIISASNQIRLSGKQNSAIKCKLDQIDNLTDYLGYKSYSNNQLNMKMELSRIKLKDMLTRTLKAYPIHCFNYPIEIIQ